MDRIIFLFTLALAVAVVLQNAFTLWVTVAIKRKWKEKAEDFMLPLEIFGYMIWLLCVLLIPRSLGTSALATFTPKAEWWQFLLAFFAQFASVVLMILSAVIWSKLSGKEMETGQEPDKNEVMSKTVRGLLSVLIFAPLAEEIVFRKILGQYASGEGVMFFIILSAITFGLMHLPMLNFQVLIFTSWCGFILSWVYLASGSFLLVFLFHAGSNLCLGVIPENLPKKYEEVSQLLLMLLGVIATIYIGFNLDLFIHQEDLAKSGSIFTKIFTNMGTYIFITAGVLSGIMFKRFIAKRKAEKEKEENAVQI